jgi:predicted RNA-binding protein YlqC (UPF0109 family)
MPNRLYKFTSPLKPPGEIQVTEWDFMDLLHKDVSGPRPSAEEMQALIVRLKNFLQYVAVQLISEPGHAQIKVQEIAPKVLRFRLVLVKRDVALLVGREGFTASAVRSILKAAAGMWGVHTLLVIHSHEDEMTFRDGGQRGDLE